MSNTTLQKNWFDIGGFYVYTSTLTSATIHIDDITAYTAYNNDFGKYGLFYLNIRENAEVNFTMTNSNYCNNSGPMMRAKTNDNNKVGQNTLDVVTNTLKCHISAK